MTPAPRVATAVLLTTGAGDELRILLVLRSPALRFFGGYWAFPGGAMEDADRACGEHATLSCALRELLEETGLGHTLFGVSRDEARAWLAAFTPASPPSGWRDALRRVADGDYLRGRALEDGDRLPLGDAPDGSPGWQLEVLHTPGHARDHLCFIESRYRAAIVGDMLSTVSTIMIDPPEGHMATYLESLERLLSVPMTILYPAHGPSHRDGHALIRQYLEHRRARERKIVEALDDTPRTLESLLASAYGDVTPAVHGAALRSLFAGLQKLDEEGRAAERDGAWVRVIRT